jgi:hypothetical protein
VRFESEGQFILEVNTSAGSTSVAVHAVHIRCGTSVIVVSR